MKIDDILRDPAWFPDRIDPAGRLIRLVRTSRTILAESPFLDGRTPIAVSGTAPVVIGLDAFIAGAAPPPPMRWILHESFCGSTLLAQIMTIEGHALCLREPQVLVDLAEWRMRGAKDDRILLDSARDATLAKLAQRWQPDEAIVVKPSNWINPVASDFWRPERGDHAVTLGIAPEDFVVAVLRGGRDRIAYVLRLYQRFASTWPMIGDAVDRAVGRLPPDAGDALIRATRLVAATHWAQAVLLRAAMSRAGNAASARFPDFVDKPDEMARLGRGLALDLPPSALDQSIAGHIGYHAKSRAPRAVDRAADAAADGTVRRLNHAAIDAANQFRATLDPLGPALEAAIADAIRGDDRDPGHVWKV